jgi:ABC-type transport system involved in cytochrome bd biosynthesis fused ATPase/permease subunit
MDKTILTTPAIVTAGLETRRLSRTVLDKTLVSDISVAVRPGEILAVTGPSGAGKSSFLRLLNRLDEPTSGTVRLNGQDYREMPAQDLRRRVGMVMQRAYLFPGTVGMNVAFGPQQQGEKLSIEQIAALLLKSLGLVWIPGVMAGMVVSGASPVYAGIYQFVVVAMILAASGVTGLVTTLLMRRRAFSAAAQLTMRPTIKELDRAP